MDRVCNYPWFVTEIPTTRLFQSFEWRPTPQRGAPHDRHRAHRSRLALPREASKAGGPLSSNDSFNRVQDSLNARSVGQLLRRTAFQVPQTLRLAQKNRSQPLRGTACRRRDPAAQRGPRSTATLRRGASVQLWESLPLRGTARQTTRPRSDSGGETKSTPVRQPAAGSTNSEALPLRGTA
ncbi:hypothetical protein NDU88_003470 [Pleurodeles waltl]|uniref:Uncharacterized protein n=1 Tax=Pleurodeles waltl TaxID=8319 RepID=A0AAV7TR81_PLEWA|nr:hypothetical protein NDU88_003470 [Pleurodeles waltl]